MEVFAIDWTNLITRIIYLFILFFIGAILGLKIIQRFELETDRLSENLLHSTLIGLGGISYCVFLLGVVNLLYSFMLIASLAGICWVCRREIVKISKMLLILASEAKRRLSTLLNTDHKYFYYPVFLFLSFFVYLTVLRTLKPLTIGCGDVFCYHLAVPKVFIRHHSLNVFNPYSKGMVIPFNIQMLYTLALLLKDEMFASTIHLGFGGLTLVAILIFCRRYFDWKVGIIASALYYTAFVIWFMGTIPMLENSVSVYGLLTFYLLWRLHETGEEKYISLAAVFTGLNLATKFATIPILLLGPVLVIWGLKFSLKKSWPFALKKAAKFILISLLVVSPWMIRSFIVTGNPVYPLYNEIFTSSKVVESKAYSIPKYNPKVPGIYSTIKKLLSKPVDWVLYLWDCSTRRFTEKYIGISFVAFLPGLILIKRNKTTLFLMLMVFIFLFAFGSAPKPSAAYGGWSMHIRYFPYIIAMMAILAAIVARELIDKNVICSIVISAVIISGLILNNYILFRDVGLGSYVLKNPSLKSKYLNYMDYRFLDSSSGYRMANFAKKNIPTSSVLFFEWFKKFFYFDFEWISGFRFDDSHILTKEEYIETFRKMGVTHIIATPNPNNNNPIRNSFYKAYTRRIYVSKNYGLYEICYSEAYNEGRIRK